MDQLILDVKEFVISLLGNKMPKEFLYHNLSHTLRVVKAVKEISEGEEVEEDEKQILEIAAWFHDVGYSVSQTNHEQLSAKIAREFLEEKNIDTETIECVVVLIMATEMCKEPKTHLEKIIRDADCSHIKDSDFEQVNGLLRKEWQLTGFKVVDDVTWAKENIKYVSEIHRFYTHYALENWQMGKDKNLAKILKSVDKVERSESKTKKKKEVEVVKKEKLKLPERGVETMFRVTLRNHIQLSNIADTKANILLSVNAIILSLALSGLLPKLDNPSNAYLIWPTMVFLGFSIVSIVLSIIATRPNVTTGKFSKSDVDEKKVNLLFFGNFHKMSLVDFEWAMNELMKDKEYLYNSMTKDLYFLGKVLNRKYKILRLTYLVFMVGIVVSVLSFIIAFANLEL